MKYNCLIVDDNMIERDAVRMHLEKITVLSIVADCPDAQEALAVANRQPIDIIFSDVEMPEMNGFELSKSFRNPPVFIFITSFSEHALEGFNADAIDFVVKPVSFQRLQKAANKAIEYIELRRSFTKDCLGNGPTPDNIIITKTAEAKDYFFIRETTGISRLNYADVLYIESMGDFSKIHTVHTDKHMILVSLKQLDEQLPAAIFKRVHKQFIVNLWQIATITSAEIILNNKQPIPVSSNYRQELMETVVNKKLLHR